MYTTLNGLDWSAIEDVPMCRPHVNVQAMQAIDEPFLKSVLKPV